MRAALKDKQLMPLIKLVFSYLAMVACPCMRSRVRANIFKAAARLPGFPF
jgi:hypothetical protein